MLDPRRTLCTIKVQFMAFRTCLYDELLGSGSPGDFLGQFDVFGVADRERVDADHSREGFGNARVYVDGRIGEDFLGEVDVLVGEVPYVAAVYSREIDAQGDEFLLTGEEIECSDDCVGWRVS